MKFDLVKFLGAVFSVLLVAVFMGTGLSMILSGHFCAMVMGCLFGVMGLFMFEEISAR